MKYTYPLNEINLSMISVVGRKSAYLGELYKMGFDIPYGFVISSRAVEESIKDIKDEISSVLSSVNLNDTSDLERKSEYIQKMIISINLPEDMEKEIYEMYDRLNSKYVAVRATVTSSLSGSSFAGEYETDLFVDREALIKSVKRVIASYYNPRAVAYRVLTQNSTKIAILVQTMINPIVAGTSFSIHPITEESDYVFIESALGLGESVTRGMVTPDQYIVSKSTRSLVSKRISEKSHKLVYDFEDKRIKRVDLSKEEGLRESLRDQDAIKIANMTIAIENIFKRNINIEWAMDDKKIYLLEVRGVRRLYPEF